MKYSLLYQILGIHYTNINFIIFKLFKKKIRGQCNNRIFWSGGLVAYINNKRWHVDKYMCCIYRYTAIILWLLTFSIYLSAEFYRFFRPFARGTAGKKGHFFFGSTIFTRLQNYSGVLYQKWVADGRFD